MNAFRPLGSVGLSCLLFLLVMDLAGCSCGSDDTGTSPTDGGDAGAMQQDAPEGMNTDGGPASGSVGAPCNATTPCNGDLVCAGGTCVIPEGECQTDNECDGDTYCCVGACLPEGSTMGICIPYGTGDRGNTNPECVGDVIIGLFEADTQCEWAGPPPGDAYPQHVQVLSTPLVANLPNDSGAAAEIVIVSYNYDDGSTESGQGSNPAFYGVIRILSGQTCQQHETIHDPENPIIAAASPAIADLDGDGMAEIVALRRSTGLIAFRWDMDQGRYTRYWVATQSALVDRQRWDGPSIHDLDDDGFPEVISGTEVYDGRTGARRNPGQLLASADNNGIFATFSVLGDVEGDGNIELIGQDVYTWNRTDNRWVFAYPGAPGGQNFAFADFGTAGATPAQFDQGNLDGVAEIVATGNNVMYLATLSGQVLMEVTNLVGGGPPTVGDFDNDNRPEIASAGGDFYRVFDLDCTGPSATCAARYVRWQQPSQDLSSEKTGSAIFDFEGDGQAEAVYADECFTRIYEGNTGLVLYSAFRTSCTWLENPVIADPDQDSNTEILISSNANCDIDCPAIDPIHPGLSCETAADCQSGVCNEGYCRCTRDEQCADGYECVAPLPSTPGAGNTCRAYHPDGVGVTGLRVLRDQLDRWASSRPLWNQHAYSVTNINDDLSVPSTSEWQQNFLDTEDLNNFRQNIQGESDAGDLPDITGRFDEGTACVQEGSTTRLVSTVCNRGNRPVGAALPATFYAGAVAPENRICTSYTPGPVPIGGCLEVSCEISANVAGEVTLVVNDDGQGGRETVECFYDNNRHTATIEPCIIVE